MVLCLFELRLVLAVLHELALAAHVGDLGGGRPVSGEGGGGGGAVNSLTLRNMSRWRRLYVRVRLRAKLFANA